MRTSNFYLTDRVAKKEPERKNLCHNITAGFLGEELPWVKFACFPAPASRYYCITQICIRGIHTLATLNSSDEWMWMVVCPIKNSQVILFFFLALTHSRGPWTLSSWSTPPQDTMRDMVQHLFQVNNIWTGTANSNELSNTLWTV